MGMCAIHELVAVMEKEQIRDRRYKYKILLLFFCGAIREGDGERRREKLFKVGIEEAV